jgi:hypothetical protein
MNDKEEPRTGFIPIRFRIAGWGMLGLGFASLAVYGFLYFWGAAPLPRTVFLFGIFATLTGFYLLFVVPRRG